MFWLGSAPLNWQIGFQVGVGLVQRFWVELTLLILEVGFQVAVVEQVQ